MHHSVYSMRCYSCRDKEISLPSVQFCHEFKTYLFKKPIIWNKTKHCLEKLKNRQIGRHSMFKVGKLNIGKMAILITMIYRFSSVQFSSVQSLSRVWLFLTPWIAACQASLSITNSRSSLRLTSIESVMPSSHLILCRPLLLLPPIPPSIGVFSNESTLRIRWPKYWSFSLSISPSNEHAGLISFRMDWLDLLTVQGTLKGLQLIKGALINMPLETWGYKGRKCNLREGVTIF